MAASGYMTEVDVESIWDTAWDTTRFGKINVRIGELINIVINSDATTDVTDTAVLPYLEHFSEEVLLDLKLAAQANAVIEPWNFIAANISTTFYRKYKEQEEMFDIIRKILNKTESVEVVNLSGFGGSNTL